MAWSGYHAGPSARGVGPIAPGQVSGIAGQRISRAGGTEPLAALVFWAHFRFGPQPQACSPNGDRTADPAMLLQVALVVLLSYGSCSS